MVENVAFLVVFYDLRAILYFHITIIKKKQVFCLQKLNVMSPFKRMKYLEKKLFGCLTVMDQQTG